MILSLVRHAATAADPARDPADWPLSDSGRAEARRLAFRPSWRNATRLVSSAEPKAVETARCIVASSGVVLETCSGLNEVKRSSFRDDYISRVEEFFQFPAKSGDDWETAKDALARVRAVITSLGNDFAGGHAVLVGHGMLWALARAWLLGQERVDPKERRAILMPDVSLWELAASGTTLISDFAGIEAWANGSNGRRSPCA